MPCASFHSFIPGFHCWADTVIIKHHKLFAPFLSRISCSRFRCHQQIRCVDPPNLHDFFLELFILKAFSFLFLLNSSRRNSSWRTHYHAETPLHRLVRHRNSNDVVGRTFWNILLVDWSVKYIDPQSCFLTRTRRRKWLCCGPGHRMRSNVVGNDL